MFLQYLTEDDNIVDEYFYEYSVEAKDIINLMLNVWQ
jgi:hypothetical protein